MTELAFSSVVRIFQDHSWLLQVRTCPATDECVTMSYYYTQCSERQLTPIKKIIFTESLNICIPFEKKNPAWLNFLILD